MFEVLAEIVVPLVVAVIGTGGLAILGKGLRDWWRRRERGRKAIEEHATIYDALTYLRHKIDATRVVVVRVSNGGGIPSAKTPLFSTALHEVTSDDAAPVKFHWQQLPLDEPYIRVLTTLHQQGEVEVDVDQIGPGTLRDIYDAAKVQTVYKYTLHSDATALYYLSLQFAQDGHRPNAPQRIVIRSTISKIRQTLSQH